MSHSNPVILITGVTGYVGHHILQMIDKTYSPYTIYATYNSRKPTIKSSNASKEINYIKMDLSTNESVKSAVDSVFAHNKFPEIIIHCAAITSPALCEKNKEESIKINSPILLMQTLSAHYKQQNMNNHPLFIFFSTDHVYHGTLSHQHSNNDIAEEKKLETLYSEKSQCYPLNNYGKSKLMMEQYLLMHWENVVILRCSVIFGPENLQKSTLLQFVVNSLKNEQSKEVILFKNETRNFVSIGSVVKTVEYLMNEHYSQQRVFHNVYNCGGVQSLTRVGFGSICAKVYGLNADKINPMNRFDCKEPWANSAPNPQDCSMSSDELYTEMKDFYKFPSLIDSITQMKADQ